MMSSMDTREAVYEELRERIAGTTPPVGVDARDVVWATGARKLGFCRSPEGGVEVFIVSDPLESSRPAVAQHIEHREWVTDSESTLGANRLLLPNEPHFDRVSAFICTELILNGVDDDAEAAFARSEELIELALTRGSVDSRALLGLCGELLLLDALLRVKPDIARTLLLHSWAGYSASTRDLQLGPVGVEVKTTTKLVSEHHIQGPHQTELGVSVGGLPETRLFLLSIGLLWLPTGQSEGFTLPSIVTRLVGHLAPGDQDVFVQRLLEYSRADAYGYEHGAPNLPSEYTRPFTTSFVRLYDLADERIHLPHSEELSRMDLDPASVQYVIRLPAEVNGTLNPVVGLATAASRLLQDAAD